MQTPSKSNPYQYTRPNPTSNESIPLRSRPFTSIDNYQHNPTPDQISEIKKKYQYIFNKSNTKPNHTPENILNSENRPPSTYNPHDSSKRQQTPKAVYEYVPRQKKVNEFMGEIEELPLRRDSLKRDYTAGKDAKSQLQSNRNTLSVMRSQLQAKLNDISARNSRNPTTKSPCKQPAKVHQDQSLSYENIVGKYAKTFAGDFKRESQPYLSSEPANELKLTPRDRRQVDPPTPTYISRVNEQRRVKLERSAKNKEQLSIISQISNSNNSEGHKENIEFEDRTKKAKIQMSHIESTSYAEEIIRKNTESSVCVREKQVDRKWFKNATSYVDEAKSATKNEKKDQMKREIRLQKLELAQGVSIKRTTTEESFMNFNKLSAPLSHQKATQKSIRQLPQTAIPSPTKQLKLYKPQGQQVKETRQANSNYKYTFLPEQIDDKEITLGRKPENNIKFTDDTQSKRSCTPTHSASGQSQIEKLKQKYKITGIVKPSTPLKQILAPKPSLGKPSEQRKCEPISRNNQAISKEIQKLDKKIKEIEQSKRELNISFTPAPPTEELLKDRSKSIITTPLRNTPSALPKQKTETKPKYAPSQRTARTPNNYLDRIKPIYSEITLPQPPPSSSFALKLIPVEITNKQQTTSHDNAIYDLPTKNPSRQYKNKLQIEARTDNGIQQRKRKLQQKTELNNNIKHLVKLFGQQAVMDQSLRNNKIWFATEHDSKWQSLQQQLQQAGVSLTQSQLKQQFYVAESENNPFFSVTDSKCNMKSLVQSYLQAQRHWQQRILHCFNRDALQKEGFNTNKVDFDRKGYIKVEDLVRFLNIESGTFLRNRDVSLIFKRLQPRSDSITFQQLLHAVST